MKLLSKLFITAALMFAASYTFAQAADTAIAQVSSFDEIKIQGAFEVYLTQGTEESVKLEAPTEVLTHIEAQTEGGVLTIRTKPDATWWLENTVRNNPNSWWHNHRVVVRITAKNLQGLYMSGSGHLYFSDGIAAGNIKIRVNGSGRIQGKITAQNIESSISGSGHIELSGTAQSSGISISGSGHFSCPDLVTANSTVHVSGSGHAEVNATEKLDASVHGSSKVVYSGHPKSISSSKSGSGSVSGS
ncbi:MAG TPA: head GIN domain-containing protein [Chitinophagaceae bacterium]|nr:head GIN domain-containing protein [Chitinophagaceae bacterium]